MNLIKEIPIKWKVQSLTKDKQKASFVAYIDARDVMNLLDKEVGIGLWKDEYKVINKSWVNVEKWKEVEIGKAKQKVSVPVEKYVVEGTISILGKEGWTGRADIGIGEEIEAEKTAYSDAFKRAAVKWGVGRFLYDIEVKWQKVDSYKNPIKANGQRIYDLAKWFNSAEYENEKYNK